MKTAWQNRVTLLVNTCDAYSDLWNPFFTLLKRYFVPLEMKILLNTESKTYAFDGLNIQTVHSAAPSYGARMRAALEQIRTEYVFLMLDDFFVRQPVRLDRMEQIVSWMDQDPDIVYFNSDMTPAAIDMELDRYPGFRRLPGGSRYTLNLQAAVWRTKKLKKYWRYDVSPWEWEERCNVLTARAGREKFYCLHTEQGRFIDYGYHPGEWMGVCHGKWVEKDVVPLFRKEHIEVDFHTRGFIEPENRPAVLDESTDRSARYKRIKKCLGNRYLPWYFLFCRRCNLYSRMHHCAVNEDYFAYLQRKADLEIKKGRPLFWGPMEK